MYFDCPRFLFQPLDIYNARLYTCSIRVQLLHTLHIHPASMFEPEVPYARLSYPRSSSSLQSFPHRRPPPAKPPQSTSHPYIFPHLCARSVAASPIRIGVLRNPDIFLFYDISHDNEPSPSTEPAGSKNASYIHSMNRSICITSPLKHLIRNPPYT